MAGWDHDSRGNSRSRRWWFGTFTQQAQPGGSSGRGVAHTNQQVQSASSIAHRDRPPNSVAKAISLAVCRIKPCAFTYSSYTHTRPRCATSGATSATSAASTATSAKHLRCAVESVGI
jgi:hypothetical protein